MKTFFSCEHFAAVWVVRDNKYLIEFQGQQGEPIMQLTFDELLDMANNAKLCVLAGSNELHQ